MASDGGNRGARGLSVELSTLAGRLRSVSNTSGQGSDYAHLTDVALESGSVSTPKSAGTGGLLSTVDTPGLPSVASPCTTPHDRWHTDNDTLEVAMDGKAVPAPKTVVGKLLAAWNAPTSSVAGTVFNISNTVIGAGILSIPFGTTLVGGVIPVVVILAIMAFLAEYSIGLMLLAAEMAHHYGLTASSYGTLGAAAFGKWGQRIVDVNVILLNLGSMAAYLVIIGDVVPPLFEHLVGPDFVLANRNWSIVLVSSILAAPLAVPRHMSFLRVTSLMSIVCVASFVALVAVILPATTDPADDFHVLELKINEGLFESLPIFGLAYTCHTTVFPIYSELERPTVPRMKRAVRLSMMLCWLLYAIVGVGGYMLFGASTEGDILVNLANKTSPAVQAVRFAFTLSVIFTFPIGFHPCRQSISAMCCGATPLETHWSRHLAVTFALYIGTLIIALALPQLEVVFGLTGATSAVLVSYILPAAFYLRLRPSAISWRNSWRQLLLIGFGVVAGIAGTAEIVSSMAAS